MKETLTILLFLMETGSFHGAATNKCHTNVNFQNIHTVNDVYELKREQCNQWMRQVCRNVSKLRISYFEMKPFTLQNPESSSVLSSGVVQHIIYIALVECCGDCLDIVNSTVKNQASLSSVVVRSTSDLRYPIYSQESSFKTSRTIPLIRMRGALFIIKAG